MSCEIWMAIPRSYPKNHKMTKTAMLIELNKNQMAREHTYTLRSEIVVFRATILVQKMN
jgi:hypothetical protein